MHVEIHGERLGIRRCQTSNEPIGEVIRVTCEARPNGPAYNAFLYIEPAHDERKRGRYISWINLYDIEVASARQNGTWSIVEPHEPLTVTIEWHPYGWGGDSLPNIADEHPTLRHSAS